MKKNGSDDNADRNGKTAILLFTNKDLSIFFFDFLDRTCKRGSITVRLYFTVDRMRGTIDRKMLECTGQEKVLRMASLSLNLGYLIG